MARKVAYKRKRHNLLGMFCVSLVVLSVFVVVLVRGIQYRNKYQDYVQQEALLREQIEDEHERTKKLEEYEKYTKTDKYVEEIAKEKLGLVYEDEIIFKSSVQGGN